MAAFKAQIENFAGTIDSEDYTTALDNGIKDVVNRMMKISPESVYQFASSSTNTAGNSYVTVDDTDKVLDVVRLESGVGKNCTELPANLRLMADDSTSLHKATVEYPVFYKYQSKVYVLPSTTTVDNIYVNKVVYGTITNASSGTSAISSFPSGLYPLVVLYASVQVLMEKVAEFTLETDIDLSAIYSSALGVPTAPDFTDPSPSLQDATSTVTKTLSTGTPDYSKPLSSFDTAQFETFLETEEDPELAQVQLGRLNKELGEYQADIQNELNEFNKENAIWTANVQRDMAELQGQVQADVAKMQASTNVDTQAKAQVLQKESQEYAQKVAIFQADWQRVAAEVGAKIQEWTTKYQKDSQQYTWLMERIIHLQQRYEREFQPYANKGEEAA
jgi:hypothetical protein